MLNNFKAMPRLLKLITVHALICAIFLVMWVVPGMTYSVFDRTVNQAEWWHSGFGPIACAIGLILPITGWLLLERLPFAREAYLGALSFGLVSFHLLPYPLGPEYDAFNGGIIVLIAAYLFFRQPVQWYFADAHSRR